MRTRIRSLLLFLASGLALAAGPVLAHSGPTLRIGGQQYPVEDPRQFGDWARDVERKAGEQPQDYTPVGNSVRRDPSTGLPTGKRMHKPLVLARGSVSVTVPAGGCMRGAHYPSATLASDGRAYELQDVSVASCSPVPSDVAEKKNKGGQKPSESMTLNFTKIEFKSTSD